MLIDDLSLQTCSVLEIQQQAERQAKGLCINQPHAIHNRNIALSVQFVRIS